MQVGKPAPEFTAPAAFPGDTASSPIRNVSLSGYRGKWLVFFWYPLDFSLVCPTEIVALADRIEEFKALDAEVLGASNDSVYCHRAWIRTPRNENGIAGTTYPILSDMTREIARDYNVLIEEAGYSLRGLFIINPEGVVVHATVNTATVARNVDEILRTLQAFQSGGFCGVNWKPGMKNLS